MLQPAFYGTAALFAALLVCGFAVTFSPSYQSCAAQDEQERPYYEQQEFVSSVGTFVICEASSLNENTGALTAMGTFAVAFFTLTLWLVTNKAANAAKKAAEALPNVESAHVFVELRGDNIKALLRRADMYADGSTPVQAGMDDVLVEFCLFNHGKTPAIIQEIRAVLDLLPQEEPKKNGADSARIIPTNGQDIIGAEKLIPFGHRVDFFQARAPKAQVTFTRDALTKATYAVRLYGLVRYEDVFDNLWEVEFSWGYKMRKDFRFERWPARFNRRRNLGPSRTDTYEDEPEA